MWKAITVHEIISVLTEVETSDPERNSRSQDQDSAWHTEYSLNMDELDPV